MLITKNLLNTTQIQQLRDFFDNGNDQEYVDWKYKTGEILDKRLNIQKNNPEYKIIEDIVKQFAPDYTFIWGAYQRQSLPHSIHLDDDSTNENTYTIVIALDTIPEFKTIIWQEKLNDNKSLNKNIWKWGNNNIKLEKKSNITELEDLEHTPKNQNNNMYCDYLTLDGIYSYEAGAGVVFNSKKIHCSNNWVKYSQHKYRDLVQIKFKTTNFYDF
jgi:hypothetical protein